MSKISIILDDGRKINLELDDKSAPISAQNFLDLVKQKYFDGLCFHRCINNFMIQGGGFFADGKGLKEKNGAKTIKGEFRSNGVANPIKHGLGVISMARTNQPNSASSQFFLCSGDCAFLDGQYAAFGKTTDEESNQVILDIAKVKTHSWMYYDDIPDVPIAISTVEIL